MMVAAAMMATMTAEAQTEIFLDTDYYSEEEN